MNIKSCVILPHQINPEQSILYVRELGELQARLNYTIYKKMGNDGGDIPGRKELVRDRKKVELPSYESIAMGRARFCNLTNQKMKEPLAICRLGNIYNYENVLEALAKKELPAKYGYIRKLKDIKKVIIDRAPADSQNYIACPISKLEYNGFNKFVAYWKCGHIISRKALKQVKTDKKVCIICQEEYEEGDLIDLNLQGKELQFHRKNLLEKRQKKEKKQNEDEFKDELKKKVKLDVHLNSMDRLGDEFRDVIRARNNFKGLFKTDDTPDWKRNTYFINKAEEEKEKEKEEKK